MTTTFPFNAVTYDPFRETFTNISILGFEDEGEDTLQYSSENFLTIDCDHLIILPSEVFNQITSDEKKVTSPYMLGTIVAVYSGEEIVVSQMLYKDLEDIPAKVMAYCLMSGVLLGDSEE